MKTWKFENLRIWKLSKLWYAVFQTGNSLRFATPWAIKWNVVCRMEKKDETWWNRESEKMSTVKGIEVEIVQKK